MEEVKSDVKNDVNINTKKYWDVRFSSGDWENKGGRSQTSDFAESQIALLGIPKNYSGSILDFGCGLGDAIPIINNAFPKAKLYGVDVSSEAISKCRESYGHLASFIPGTHEDVPCVDIIISSNVFEHLTDDLGIAKSLMSKCKKLIIVVPYKETPLCHEHIRSYDETHFLFLGEYKYKIFKSKGWTESGINLFKYYIKNIIRLIMFRKMLQRRMQIMFIFDIK